MSSNYYTERIVFLEQVKPINLTNPHQLSYRQLEILRLIRLPDSLIAKKLERSSDTIHYHIKMIRKKANLTGSSREELVNYAITLFGLNVVMRD